MNTCVICGVAYDPVVSEDGKELIDNATGICLNCLKKYENKEITLEKYDSYSLENDQELIN